MSNGPRIREGRFFYCVASDLPWGFAPLHSLLDLCAKESLNWNFGHTHQSYELGFELRCCTSSGIPGLPCIVANEVHS